jgi:hypothetical protein
MQAAAHTKTQATANIFKILIKLGPSRLACLFFFLLVLRSELRRGVVFEVPGLNDIRFFLLFFLFLLAAIISYQEIRKCLK